MQCRAILAKFGPQIARWTLFFLLVSCGMYISSTAFLPSSFAMYLGMLALGAWFEGAYEVILTLNVLCDFHMTSFSDCSVCHGSQCNNWLAIQCSPGVSNRDCTCILYLD